MAKIITPTNVVAAVAEDMPGNVHLTVRTDKRAGNFFFFKEEKKVDYHTLHPFHGIRSVYSVQGELFGGPSLSVHAPSSGTFPRSDMVK